MHGNEAEFLESITGFVGAWYLFAALMNTGAALYLWRSGRVTTLVKVAGVGLNTLTLWALVATVFVTLSGLAFGGGVGGLRLPQALRDALDAVMAPQYYVTGMLVFLAILYVARRFFVQPVVAWGGLNFVLLYMGLSITDPDFASIVTKPDNVPIVGLVYLLGFFTWLGAYKAVLNDDRLAEGLEPLEKADDEKVLVWPDLVYTELICMVALTALLLVWGILLQAPLEEAASTVKTPNPSKAPWYFLGLQEMLVYYDPWMAGVVLPSVVVAGLMAIPYIDYNKAGSGYYTISQRKFAYVTFQFGFLVLWVTLIVMGTFMRGPNWNFFGLYETWDAHKVEALNNVDLSEYFWVSLLGSARPSAPLGSSGVVSLGYILLREAPGFVCVFLYFAALPPAMVLGCKWMEDRPLLSKLRIVDMKELFLRAGFVRYMVISHLLLLMGLLPLKMVLRWTVNMKYFISIPEYFLNF